MQAYAQSQPSSSPTQVTLNDARTLLSLQARARRDAVRIGGRPEDGEEAFSDVLLRVQTDERPLESPALFRTCVIRRTRDILRGIRRHRSHSIDTSSSAADAQDSPSGIGDLELFRYGHFNRAIAEEQLITAEEGARREDIAHRLPDVLEAEKEFTRRSLLAAGCGRLDDEDREEIAPILDLGEARDTHELAEITGRSWDSVYFTAYRAAARLARELEL